MGIFDFFKKKEQSTNTRTESSKSNISKSELEKAIKALTKLSYLFKVSTTLKATGGDRNEKQMNILHSYAAILGYHYEFIYSYGSYSSLVDSQMQIRYALVVSSLSDPSHRANSFKQLSENWSDVLVSILCMQNDQTTEGNAVADMQSEIDTITKIIESISGSKCKDPQEGLKKLKMTTPSKVNNDKITCMIEEASFNPFNITTKTELQPKVDLPDYTAVFKTELTNMFSNVLIRENMDEKTIFSSYIFNLVESYYKNAGFVPKNAIDNIIKQCHNAVKQTPYGDSIDNLENVRYQIYYNLLHN